MSGLLVLKNLAIGYGQTIVQKDLNLSAPEGTMIAMLGQNGCGKSTLLRTLSGLQPQLNGEVFLDGKKISELSSHEKATLMSLVLTERHSVGQTKVYDVVAMGRHPYTSFLGTLTDDDRQIVYDALNNVAMTQKAEAYFNELSDGEKQRVLIAKALAQQTPIILLDEPTAHLDLPNRIKTMLLLRKLAQEQHKLIIISTHELDLAQQTADYIWLMSAGKGIVADTPEKLRQTNAYIDAFPDLPEEWRVKMSF